MERKEKEKKTPPSTTAQYNRIPIASIPPPLSINKFPTGRQKMVENKKKNIMLIYSILREVGHDLIQEKTLAAMKRSNQKDLTRQLRRRTRGGQR